DFPAPVSPVSTLNPRPNCTSSSSMIANALTRSSSSMARKSSRPPRQCYAGLVQHPRAQQLLELAELAIGDGLMDFQRPIWRELVTELLGSIRKDERRQHLRAPLELEVDNLAPDELASLATSSVGAGGLAIRM